MLHNRCGCGCDDNTTNRNIPGFHLLLLCRLQVVVALMGGALALGVSWGAWGEVGVEGGVWSGVEGGVAFGCKLYTSDWVASHQQSHHLSDFYNQSFYCKAQPSDNKSHS